jgi:hypothetical protein
MSSVSHNLDINNYSLDELLGLFNLSYKIDFESMKNAKKKVLSVHPDKSRLPPEYFIFYKKAYEVVFRFYQEQNRQNQAIPTEPVKYEPVNETNKQLEKQMKTAINGMKEGEFNNSFNELFEKNMVTKPDETRNEWFIQDEPVFQINETASSKNIGQVFQTIRDNNISTMTKYRGVETINSNFGTGFYDDEKENSDEYVSCDPFSKLKFDDLRKVHKDQTILPVSERDFDKMKKYDSVDQLNQERGSQSLTPLEKAQAEQILEQRKLQYEQDLMKKKFQSNLRTMEYEEKNREIMGNFLRIKQ